jgi:hypothetical protein
MIGFITTLIEYMYIYIVYVYIRIQPTPPCRGMSISVLTSGVEKSAAALSDIAVECGLESRRFFFGDVPMRAVLVYHGISMV